MTEIDPAKKRLLEARGFSELIRQVQCVQRLKTFGDLYGSKNCLPEHLTDREDGIGKATIARAFAKAYNSSLPNVLFGNPQVGAKRASRKYRLDTEIGASGCHPCH